MSTLTRPRPVAAAPAAPDAREAFTGTGRLLRFALRRDRVRIPLWALGVGGLIGYFGVVLPVAYPDPTALQTRAALMGDPAGAFMTGPGYGLADYTFGVLVANEMLGMLAVAAALMSIFLVTRHTRAEEESGRAELVRAGVVGRLAPLTAALLTLLVANAAVAAALLAALVGNDLAVTDSAAVALGVAVVGLVLGAVTAVTAQLGESTRSSSGMAGAVLALFYVLRGVGDAQQTGGSLLSWLSPVGWVQQTRAFVDLRWWPLLLGVALALLLVAAAYALVGRRDVGAGLLAARGGPADARAALLSPVGLGWRLERTSVLWWSVGMAVMALLTGSLAQGIVDSFESQPQLAEVFGEQGGADVLGATMAAFLGFFAMAVTVYAVVSTNRLRREETEGRTGAVLATGVGRHAWLGASVTVTTLGATVLLLVNGLALGVGVAASVGDVSLVAELTLASVVHLPLVLCFVGLAALGYGLRAATWWVWLVLVGSIVVGLYGPLLDLPDVVLDAAPFGLVPAVPAEDLDVVPLLGMAGVAAVLLLAAAATFRRRDLTA
ncbi:ABC transporter permease [Aquipuribacter sp. MA13-6]|uniref:ABC transporter permease n=1 Tax=unclassified Aquipuribacter TaxID=2635084 RepID=UPI003EEEF33D